MSHLGGVEKVENFTSMRTPEGDKIVCRAHEAARAVIKELYPEIKVGLTLSLHDIQSTAGGEEHAKKEWDDEFTHYLPYIQNDDFLGVQNYTRSLMGPEGTLPAPDGAELTQMKKTLIFSSAVAFWSAIIFSRLIPT